MVTKSTAREPIPEYSVSEDTLQPKKENSAVPVLVSIIFLLLLVIGGLIYYVVKKGKEVPTQITAIPTVTPTTIPESTPMSTNGRIFFLRDYEVWQKENESEKPLTQTEKGVVKFIVSPKHDYVVTIEGTSKNVDLGYKTRLATEPERVVLYSINKNTKNVIYEQKRITKPNEEFVLELKDISFSADGNFIAITTSDSLLIYDLPTGSKETIFANVNPTPTPAEQTAGFKDIVYSYYNSTFSPNNDWIFVDEGHWEWSKFVVVNRKTHEFIRLEYGSNIGGQGFMSWYDNDRLLLSEIVGGVDAVEQENVQIQLFIYNPKTKERENFLTMKGYQGYVSSDGTYVYHSHQYNQLENGTRFYYPTVTSINLKTKESKVLFSSRQTEKEASNNILYGAPYIDQVNKKIYLTYFQYDQQTGTNERYSLYSFDLDGENQQPKVIVNNGALLRRD